MSTFSAFVIDGIAALGATGLVLTFVAPPGGVSHPSIAPPPPAVTLTAQAQPLPVQLFNEQIAFNVNLTVNFVTTGAALAQRIVQIPGALASEVRNGTPLPIAVAGALTAFADIEFQAGRDLIGYGLDIANFEIQLLTRALSALSPFTPAPGRRIVAAVTTTQTTKSKALQRHSTIIGPPETAPSRHQSEPSGHAKQQHHVHPADAAHVHRISQAVHQSTHAKGTHRH